MYAQTTSGGLTSALQGGVGSIVRQEMTLHCSVTGVGLTLESLLAKPNWGSFLKKTGPDPAKDFAYRGAERIPCIRRHANSDGVSSSTG